MKCPKCLYLGFETGDRCKNCGYDFSLLPLAESSDLVLQTPADGGDAGLAVAPVPDAWEEPDLDLRPHHELSDIASLSAEVAAAGAGSGGPSPVRARTPGDRVERGLPLFSPPSGTADVPLIRVPASPRPPLAVRRTTEAPRFKASLPTLTRNEDEPDLGFSERPASTRPIVVPSARAGGRELVLRREACESWPRAMAALLDMAILVAIDLAVVYFTLRMAVLTMDDWRLLPAIPMLVFLSLLKVAYFAAFTAVGGQTIGKMAAHIRVVADDDTLIGPARALQRTLVASTSVLTLGAAFVPALVGDTGRALHDRVAHTRVVAVPPA